MHRGSVVRGCSSDQLDCTIGDSASNTDADQSSELPLGNADCAGGDSATFVPRNEGPGRAGSCSTYIMFKNNRVTIDFQIPLNKSDDNEGPGRAGSCSTYIMFKNNRVTIDFQIPLNKSDDAPV
ncbi:hypothetical protein PHSY_004942 [Pseudozyma hubeiensis SY62]|uniref:Uncharacterized protein n=1 Tax=Pseudozyma hubeiensis (strain SY62) TaxID=1305764 RepID=R9P802_PSEHS|nr:hypothetical protein PHSY_004942 [Pseudozyma hubeiensis SY62]GAC97357.1 hypothetical protein PHSY_004942 [Pseudozyma hubeiensis SY62]